MALVINTNMPSLNAQRNLSRTQNPLQSALQRLSSGLRINSAKDDAAGVGIASRMSAQIRGLSQASRNANNAVSLTQTMEGGLDQIHEMLQRMRELAVQSADDSNATADRTSLHAEFADLRTEIDRIADSTKFNGTNVLNAATAFVIQVGADNSANDQISITSMDANVAVLSATLGAATLTTLVGAQAAIDSVDLAITAVNTNKGTIGAINNRLDYTVANLSNIVENLTSAKSRITDADFAVETANMTKYMITQQAAISVLAQANQIPQQVLALLGR